MSMFTGLSIWFCLRVTLHLGNPLSAPICRHLHFKHRHRFSTGGLRPTHYPRPVSLVVSYPHLHQSCHVVVYVCTKTPETALKIHIQSKIYRRISRKKETNHQLSPTNANKNRLPRNMQKNMQINHQISCEMKTKHQISGQN